MQIDALYYPYIHIRDDDWLKVAALYWPSVRRLVPQDYRKRDSATAKAFADAQVLVDADPGWLLDQVSWDLLTMLQRNADELVRHFGLTTIRQDETGSDLGDPPFDSAGLGWIHLSKFDPHVLAFLQTVGLAHLGREPMIDWQRPHVAPSQWVGMHPAVAGAYMTALAQQVAQQAIYQPLTDQNDLRTASPLTHISGALELLTGSQATADASSDDVGECAYVMVALQYPRPANLAGVSAKRIVECRRKLAGELQAFQDYVTAQHAELAELANTTSIKERQLELFARHVEEKIKRPLQQLERGLTLLRMAPVRSTIMASSLTPPAVAGALMAGSPAAATAAGVVAAVGSAWWQTAEQRRSQTAASPVGYLLDIRDQLTPRTLPRRVRKILRGTYSSTRQ